MAARFTVNSSCPRKHRSAARKKQPGNANHYTHQEWSINYNLFLSGKHWLQIKATQGRASKELLVVHPFGLFFFLSKSHFICAAVKKCINKVEFQSPDFLLIIGRKSNLLFKHFINNLCLLNRVTVILR